MPTDRCIADVRILRLSLGTALALWFSQAIGWSMSFVAPVFALLVLASPKPALTFKAGIAIIVLIAATAHGGLLLLPLLLHHTATGILLLAVILFHIFYFSARGGNAVLGTLMVVSLALTVAVGSVSRDAVLAVAEGISIAALVGIVFVWIAFALLPDPQSTAAPLTAQPESTDDSSALRSALRSLTIVLPIAIVFLFWSDSAGYVAVMIKVTSMTQQASAKKTGETAVSLLLSTLIGGIAALVGWVLLGIWPLLTLYVLFVALAGLYMGRQIFSGEGLSRNAATWSFAYLTMIVILAPAVTDSLTGSTASIAFLDRLLMFAGATLYGVTAVYVFDRFTADRAPCPSSP